MNESAATVRIGVIGAGQIFRDRHAPGLKAIPNVELVAVSNRSEKSSRAAQAEFGFAHVEPDWRSLVAREDLDAVLIGTWPYTHAEMSVAALDAGKHVFCQARMAATLDGARRMVDAAERHPDLVNHICPPPTRMPFEPFVRHELSRGAIGALREVRLVSLNGAAFGPLHWRERVEFSGIQIMAVGILAETLIPLVGEFKSLIAHGSTPLATKPDERGNPYTITIPQTLTVAGELASGVPFTETHSGLHRGDTAMALDIVGADATLRWDFKARQLLRDGEPVDVPADQQRGWNVERDFIAAVRGQDQPGFSNTFAEGYRYMAKMDAIRVSIAEHRWVRREEFEK